MTRFESRYQWLNDNLISETRTKTINNLNDNHDLHINTTITTIDYISNTNDKIGFTLNNKDTYYYVKNIFGDVIKIIGNKSNVVAEYTYDAWGNHKIIINIDGIAELNPIRYRSYYFDSQTNLYYLKSRYYDPQTGRFINMDALSYVDPDNIGGLNLYVYCNNNPVMQKDPNGTFIISGIIGGIIIGAIIGGAVAVAVHTASAIFTWATGGGFHWCWRDFGSSVLSGAVIGGILGSGVLKVFGKLATFMAGALSNTISMLSDNVFGDGDHSVWDILKGAAVGGVLAVATAGLMTGLTSKPISKFLKKPKVWKNMSAGVFADAQRKFSVKINSKVMRQMFAHDSLKKTIDILLKGLNNRFGTGRLSMR